MRRAAAHESVVDEALELALELEAPGFNVFAGHEAAHDGLALVSVAMSSAACAGAGGARTGPSSGCVRGRSQGRCASSSQARPWASSTGWRSASWAIIASAIRCA